MNDAAWVSQRKISQLVGLCIGALVPHIVTIVWSGEDRHHLVFVKLFIALLLNGATNSTSMTNSCPRTMHFSWLSSRNCSETSCPYVWLMPREEGFHPLSVEGSDQSKSQKRPSWRIKEKGCGREKGYQRDFLEAIQRVDLIDVVERRTNSCVNCEDFIVNNSTEREAIAGCHKIIPHTLIIVVPHAKPNLCSKGKERLRMR